MAGRLDLSTAVEIYSDGGRVYFTVAGTTVVAGAVVEAVRAIEIQAMDSVYPPGGRYISATVGDRPRFRDALPSRFTLPRGKVVPVGDWFLDEGAGTGIVYRRQLEPTVRGDFSIKAEFVGRALHFVTLRLLGDPTLHFRFRRGLINNDAFICDAEGTPIKVASIDPCPGQRLLGAIAILVRGAAAGAALIALGLLPCPVPRVPRLSPHPWAVVILLALVAAGISAWVARDVFEGLPHVPDAVTYLVQARWLLAGDLVREAPALSEHLTIPFTQSLGGRWIAQYPIGWPLLLALGMAVGLPGLVSPLLAAAYTVLLFLTGRELGGNRLGLIAAGLALVSPMSTLMFASFMCHGASSTLILLAIWAGLRAEGRPGLALAAGAGVSLGYVLSIRPLTAIAVGFVLVMFMLFELERLGQPRVVLRRLIGFAGGGLVGALPGLLHNSLVTGNALSFAYSEVSGSMYSLADLGFGIANFDAILAHTVPALFAWGWPLAPSGLLIALPLAFAWVPFLLGRLTRHDLLLAGLFGAVAVAHLGARAHGLHGFGPRYYFDVFFCLYLLTGRGLEILSSLARPSRPSSTRLPLGLPVALFVVLNLAAIVTLPGRLSLYRGYNGVDGSLRRQITELGLRRALVVFPVDEWSNWGQAAEQMSADPWADLAFATLCDDNTALFEFNRGRPIYTWHNQSQRLIRSRPEPSSADHGLAATP